MIDIPLSRRVVLLIDGDNTQLRQIQQVLQISNRFGTLLLCRAYGDWKKSPLSSWCKEIVTLNIDLIQQDRNGKNATDHRLMLEAVEILVKDEPDIFIIVSGDSDFTELCEFIKGKGKQVIGIGSKKHTSRVFREVCNKFIFMEDLENELSKAVKYHPIATESPKFRAFENLLDSAFSQLPQKDGWVHYAQLGKKLRELDRNFKSKFGNYRLSKLLKNLEHYESRDQMVRRI